MLEQIFPDIASTKERANINGMLRGLYGSSMTVSDALHNYSIKLQDDPKRDLLAHLVLSVRNKLMEPEYLDLDPNGTIKLWAVTRPFTWTCIRISSQEEWDRAVAYLCKAWAVDTDWGTFRDGMDRFDGEDIYMFRKYIDEFVIDSPDSNWDGCKSSHTFLTVTRRDLERETYLGYLHAIEEGESEACVRYLD